MSEKFEQEAIEAYQYDSPNNPCSRTPNGCDYDWSE